jgi:hypothetical protein
MQKKIIYATVLISAIWIFIFSIAKSSSTGAQYGLCGAPDDIAPDACGNQSCHNFNPIAGSPSLKITMLDASNNKEVTTWHVSRKYLVRIELNRASIQACGFESTVETSSGNQHVGTYLPIFASNSRFSPFSGIYVTHRNSTKAGPGYGKWEYYWTSPASATLGDITIYAAANDANGDDHNTGDSIFTTNKTFAFLPSSGIDQSVLYSSRISVFPNPVKDVFAITYELAKPSEVHADLYNTAGQLIKTLKNQYSATGISEIRSDISDLSQGIYFVKLTAGNEVAWQKIIKD